MLITMLMYSNPRKSHRQSQLTLYKGQTYRFEVDAVDMPFSIRTSLDLTNDDNLFKGITGQKVEQGVLEFEVDLEAPDVLYYVNENDIEGPRTYYN